MNEWEWQLLEAKHPAGELQIASVAVKPGHRVRLHPRQGGDIFDLALAGQTATIEAIEQDYEGKFQVCVVLDDDPGRDLGFMRQPGHRFFFDPAEIEPIDGEDARPAVVKPTILVAGIGNIFLGDDAFGVEVAQRLALLDMSQTVRVADFGIRGFDLACALLDGYETVILVDAYPHGAVPGTVSLVAPQLDEDSLSQSQDVAVEGHGMHPAQVLRLASAMGARLQRVLLVGCQPEDFGGEEGRMGLTATVAASVDEAVRKIESLIAQITQGEWPAAQSEEQE